MSAGALGGLAEGSGLKETAAPRRESPRARLAVLLLMAARGGHGEQRGVVAASGVQRKEPVMKNVVRAGSFLFVLTVAVHALAAPAAGTECAEAPSGGEAGASADQSGAAPLSSCCDKSTFTVFNDSDDTWVVANVDVKSGKFSGIKVGDAFGTEESIKGHASSASGSNGAAKGTISIKAGGSNDRFDLTYWFVPATMYGSCPCSVSVSTNPLHSGPYTADALTTTGQHNGEAKVKWDLSN